MMEVLNYVCNKIVLYGEEYVAEVLQFVFGDLMFFDLLGDALSCV